MDLDEEFDFDLDWVKEQERMVHIEKNAIREPMKSINIHFVYVNLNSTIHKTITEKYPLVIHSENNRSVLQKEKLMKMIQGKKSSTFLTKYIFMDILIHNIDLESNFIQKYIQDSGSPSFLKTMPILDDIYFESSIFIFHPLNAVYIFFKEVEKDIILHPKPFLHL